MERNPYFGADFFHFFSVLLHRLFGFITGNLGWDNLVSDEVQLIVLGGIGASGALVGTFLVLRKMTMLANGISHTILLGIVIAYFFSLRSIGSFEGHGTSAIHLPTLLAAAILTGVATAFLTEFFTKTLRLQEDASTGLIFTFLFALGIVLVTVLTKSSHIGTEAVMGNVDALQREDCWLVFVILTINALLIALFFKEYQLTTFDPALAQALGFSTVGFNYLLMVQVSATIVGAFRAVGVLMVLAFITAPVLTARLLTHRLKTLLFVAIGYGVAASLIGVALARHFLSVYDLALSTGGIVVTVMGMLFLGTLAYTMLWENRLRVLHKNLLNGESDLK